MTTKLPDTFNSILDEEYFASFIDDLVKMNPTDLNSAPKMSSAKIKELDTAILYALFDSRYIIHHDDSIYVADYRFCSDLYFEPTETEKMDLADWLKSNGCDEEYFGYDVTYGTKLIFPDEATKAMFKLRFM